MSKTLNEILRGFLVLWLSVHFGRASPAGKLLRNDKLTEMRNYINASWNPCDNFYEFACGNWPQQHPLTEDTARVNFFDVMQNSFDRKVKVLLLTSDAGDTKDDRIMKDLYKSCLNLKHIANDYNSKMLALIDEFGQMPAVEGDHWNASDFDWLQLVGDIRAKYGSSILLNVDIIQDFDDNSVKGIVLGRGGIFLDDKSSYFNEDAQVIRKTLIKGLKSNLINFLKLNRVAAKKVAKEIVDFEFDLAQGLSEEGLPSQDVYPPITVEELQRKYWPAVDVKKLVITTVGSIPPFRFYEQHEYLKNLVAVIERTPKRIVANYIYYKLIHDFLLSTFADEEAQQDFCIEKAKEYFPTYLESLVYRKYNTERTRNDLVEMWKNIKLAFEDVLRSPRLSWMKETTRQHALEKLKAMRFLIPALENNETEADDVDDLVIDEHDFVANLKSLRSLAMQEYRKSLYKPPEALDDIADDTYSPTNSVTENLVAIPVAILQPHFMFGQALPSAATFAKLGFLLSHEVLHGFDDTGRQYDKQGNPRDWWDNQSELKFNELKQCFEDQYSSYLYAGEPLHKPSSQAENIADNGGLRLAYMAYLKWYEDSSRSRQELVRETFPNFQYTYKQLFFISFAQMWCTNTDPEYKLKLSRNDEHAPEEVRVMLSLSNLKEFSQEFNCPSGSAMNPITKCEIY